MDIAKVDLKKFPNKKYRVDKFENEWQKMNGLTFAATFLLKSSYTEKFLSIAKMAILIRNACDFENT